MANLQTLIKAMNNKVTTNLNQDKHTATTHDDGDFDLGERQESCNNHEACDVCQ